MSWDGSDDSASVEPPGQHPRRSADGPGAGRRTATTGQQFEEGPDATTTGPPTAGPTTTDDPTADDATGAADGAPEATATVPRQRLGAGASPEPFTAGDGEEPADLELVGRVREGETGASEELYRRHAEAVRRYARTCCRDSDTADDLTNEVFAATLQAIRGGAGPQTAVRAYLLTSVRRVAAAWARTAKREHLVEDFAVFSLSAAGGPVDDRSASEVGADVRAMHEAEQSMAVQAFRSLPERWQTVLWHTTVEESSPQEVAPLLGLTPNATAVLAHRAREGLKQAYLQAHVSQALTSGGGCARYADRLGAFARGGLRSRAERGLREHLADCAACRAAALEVKDLNQHIRSVLPIAIIGWFAAGYSLKAAGVVGGTAGAGVSAGAAAAATGGGASGSGAGGAAAAEGLGAPVKAGLAAAVAAAVTAGALALLFLGDADQPSERPQRPEAAAPSSVPEAEPEPEPAPEEQPDEQPEEAQPDPATPSEDEDPAPAPEQTPPDPSTPPASPPEQPPAPEPTPPQDPQPEPDPPTEPEPGPEPEDPPASYEIRRLEFDLLNEDSDDPTVRFAESSWTWQRDGMTIGGTEYRHGITVAATSSVVIDLNRPCSVYRAQVGIDDMTAGIGGASFSVHGDDRLLWRSPDISAGEAAVPFRVGVEGVRTLRLTVEPRGLLGDLAVANWAESELTCS